MEAGLMDVCVKTGTYGNLICRSINPENSNAWSNFLTKQCITVLIIYQISTMALSKHLQQSSLNCAQTPFDSVSERGLGTRLAVHCKEGIVITTESLLFQIQMSEHNSLPCGGELHDNLFLILSQLSSTLSYHLGN